MWFFFFKQKTAYEMRISDWSSDVCSSDLYHAFVEDGAAVEQRRATLRRDGETVLRWAFQDGVIEAPDAYRGQMLGRGFTAWAGTSLNTDDARSEERRGGKECVSTFRSRWSPEH